MRLSILETGNWRLEAWAVKEFKVAILKTLAYSAVFNFPLTKEEILRYLINNFQFSPPLAGDFQFSDVLDNLQDNKLVCEENGHYFLPGFEQSVEQRKEREKIAQKKFAIAEKFCKRAGFIPTIQMIGVSGALAMKNVHEDDDIDLFIVAQAGTVWTTRFLTVLLAEMLGVRRRPEGGSLNVKDRICLNMFVDEDHMRVPTNEQDLFSAHEVVQMKPIYLACRQAGNKGDTYYLFIKENEWVRKYLPNAILEDRRQSTEDWFRKTENGGQSWIERLLRAIQMKYMKNKRTNEVINDGYLRFHPSDMRKFILRRYSQILNGA